MFRGMETPSHKEPIDLNKIKARTLATKISKPNPKDSIKLPKDNSPSPHTYRKEEAYDKTKKANIRFSFPKCKQESFID